MRDREIETKRERKTVRGITLIKETEASILYDIVHQSDSMIQYI